jgi:HK97 family phage portal protein
MNRLDLSRELAKALNGAKAPNTLNRQLYFTLADGQPVWMGDNQEAFVRDAYAYNPDVYSVVTAIARACAGVPWIVHKVTNRKAFSKYKRMPSEAKQANLSRVILAKEQAMEEVDDSHPLYDLLERPNPYQGGSEFREAVFGFKLITGNAYVHGVRIENGRDAGKVAEMWTMPSQFIEIVASSNPETVIKGYRLTWYNGVDLATLPAEDVMHLKYFNPNYAWAGHHLYGMSPLQSARRVVTRSNEAYTANAKMLKNMSPPGILMLDDPNVDFTPEQASQLERQWAGKIGPEKAGKMMVTAAKFNYVQLGLSPVDLNIIESQKMDLRDICNVYGVSSELFNDPDNKTNANKEQSRKALYYERVIPELDLLRDELNRWLLPAYNRDGEQYHIDYDLSAIPALQDDMEKQMAVLKESWWLTGNEKRTAQGYDTDPLMDGYFVPSGLVPWTGEVDLDALKRLPNEF